MGLDISVYSGLSKILDTDGNAIHVGPLLPDTWLRITNGESHEMDTLPSSLGHYDKWVLPYANIYFPTRSLDITNGCYYTYRKVTGFRAGSYSGYSIWREMLAMIAEYRLAPYGISHGHSVVELTSHRQGLIDAGSGPFYELIYFSDCEGILGTETCKKLAKDFEDFDDIASVFKDNEYNAEWFYNLYTEWKEAFQSASDNGLIMFH